MSGFTDSDKMKELTDMLESGTKAVFESGRYKEYLGVMAKFHRYSARNSLLILLQNPEASQVASFGAWKSMERSINKGEKGIQILAPVPYKKTVEVTRGADGELLPEPQKKEITAKSYRPVYVFDVSQTNGRELPRLVTQLMGTVPEHDKMMRCLRKVSPCLIQFESSIQGNANGYYEPTKNYIGIKMGMAEEQTIKTMVHEIAHGKLGHGDNINIDRQTGEVQAESVAFVVCQHFGIDSSQYSFGYIAGWSKDKELPQLTASLEVIQKTAREIIDSVELELTRELTVEKELAAMTPEETKSLISEVKFAEAFDKDITEHDKLLYEAAIKSQHAIKQPEKVAPDVPAMTQDGFSLFYAGAGGQDKQAYDFQQETGWNMAWGSDSSGLNGDTWIVYRSVEDLPKRLRKIVPKLGHEQVQEKPTAEQSAPEKPQEAVKEPKQQDKVKKPPIAERLAAAKKECADRDAARAPQAHTHKRQKSMER